MKYYIIAGEASGDLHGSNLIKEIKLLDAQCNIQCWGGDLMQQAGAILIKHYRELAFMGFAEVIKNLPTILKNIKFCKQHILEFKPDVLVLIDYPGFNLRIAKWAKQQGIKVVYYISPQVWAWKESRVKTMKQCIDKMICILPFEKEYYKTKWNWDVEYVGHPLIEVIDEFKVESLKLKVDDEAKPIAILPGSRKQEIAKKLPIMLEVTKAFPSLQFVIAKAPALEDDFYSNFLKPYPNVSTVSNQTYLLLTKAKAALVTSGTATLETALFAVPQAVCYKASNISYQIGKRLVKIKFIALANLIMDKQVVKEFIQEELTAQNLSKELEALLYNQEYINKIQQDYKALYQLLSQGGKASAKAAKMVVEEAFTPAHTPS